jgi:Domain of unknown function (DUF4192)
MRVRDPGELVAIVPALIGFHPRDSLVMIATGGPTGRRIGLTVRVDLPPAGHVDAVVTDAVRGLLLDDPAGAAAIVLSERSGRRAGPPRPEVAAAVLAALDQQGVDVHTLVWAPSTATGSPWACYEGCCAGILPDPASTAFAATVVAGGQVIHTDRGALERLVAPADPGRIRRRERLLIGRLDATAADRAADAVPAVPEPAVPEPADPVSAGLALIDDSIAAAAAGRLNLSAEADDATVVELACALTDLAVRDAALLRNVGPAAGAAEQLWTALVRELPDPEAAEPATLLAVSALLRGDGALANVALDRAQQAWPGHRLGRMLRTAAEAGIRPAQVRAWLTGDDDPATR